MLKIKNLIIVGGPSCAGKSFLLNKIQRGDWPHLSEQLEIDEPSLWHYVKANELPQIDQSAIERLVVHYDLYTQQARENELENLHGLLRNSKRVSLLTVHASPNVLTQRLTGRLMQAVGSLLLNPWAYKKKFRRLRKLWNKRKYYIEGSRTAALYKKWFAVVDEYPLAHHWLFDSSKPGITIASPYDPVKAEVFIGAETNTTTP